MQLLMQATNFDLQDCRKDTRPESLYVFPLVHIEPFRTKLYRVVGVLCILSGPESMELHEQLTTKLGTGAKAQ